MLCTGKVAIEVVGSKKEAKQFADARKYTKVKKRNQPDPVKLFVAWKPKTRMKML